MAPTSNSRRLWIHHPVSDLIFFGYSWIFIFVLLLTFQANTGTIIILVLLFNYVHRHYTFPLVYGENEEFSKRKKMYSFLPLGAILVTTVFVLSGNFNILLMISVLWTMFHSVAQKAGITRVYSRKAGYGDPRVEKGLIYSWFYYLFFGIAQAEKETLLTYTSGRTILEYAGDYLPVFTLISYAILFIAIYFSLLYLYQEYCNRHQLSLPKNLYVLSTMLLYMTFTHSLIFGYITFAFSHALEYIAFVNIYVRSKYKDRIDYRSPLAIASRNLKVYSSGFAVLVLALCALGRYLDPHAFSIYIVGSSFLHFIYDGWIWKVRKPSVGEPLGIRYPLRDQPAP